MSDTIRELNIKAIIARLACITAENGYATDIGTNVVRARKSLDPEELPACAVFPQPETVEMISGYTQCIMPVRIEGIVKFGGENPSEAAERVLGDIIACLAGRGWVRLPDYIDSIAYAGGGTDEYPDEGSVTVGTSALFNVKYMFKIGDPYSQ
ncbi:MAG: hypothetical protein RBT16_11315 [Desulfococcus multivorans]|jgi:hypothetical protein|nr:hypothetical protein [Desulfococcus multivorans]